MALLHVLPIHRVKTISRYVSATSPRKARLAGLGLPSRASASPNELMVQLTEMLRLPAVEATTRGDSLLSDQGRLLVERRG